MSSFFSDFVVKQEELEEEICPVCESKSFENLEGHYYCIECGTQSQVKRDEELEDDPNRIVIMSHQLRVKKGQKRKLDEEDEDDCTMSLYESWQFIYQFYIECLIKEKICEPDTRKCAKLLWFMFLKYVFYHQLEAYNKIDTMELPCNRSSTSHYLSYDKLIKLTKQMKKNKSYNKRKEKEREEEEESDEDNEDLLNDANKLEEMLEKSHQISIIRHAYISKRTLILLLYLSLLYSGKYIIINDFLNLIYSDVIPYYSWYQAIPRPLVMRLLTYQRRRMTDNNTPFTPFSFSTSLYKVKNSLCLQVLPFDFMEMAKVLLQKLLLPDSLLAPLKRLLYIYQDSSLPSLRKNSVLVDVTVMLNIIILMKLIYRLDDIYEKEQAYYSFSMEDDSDKSNCTYLWEDWVSMVTRAYYNEIQSSIRPSHVDLVHMDNAACYIKCCKEKYFDTFTVDSATGAARRGEKGEKFQPLYSSFIAKRRERRRKEDEGTERIEDSRHLFVSIGDKVHTIPEVVDQPRWVRLNLNIQSLGAACSQYHILPRAKYHLVPLHQLELSQSQQFLYYNCARVINVPLDELLFRLRLAEQYITSTVSRGTEIIEAYQRCKEKNQRKEEEVVEEEEEEVEEEEEEVVEEVEETDSIKSD